MSNQYAIILDMKIILFLTLSFASIHTFALEIPYKAGDKVKIKSTDAVVFITTGVSTTNVKAEMTPVSHSVSAQISFRVHW